MKPLFFLSFLFCLCDGYAQNVGIGTNVPTMPLHVRVATDSNILLLEKGTTLAPNTNLAFHFKLGDWYTGSIKSIGTGINAARLGVFTYATLGVDGLRERMSITDAGNVGINNTTPLSTLDVSGNLRVLRSSNTEYTAEIINSTSRGKGALKVAMGSPTGLFEGNPTLFVENDTITGTAIRSAARWSALSSQSITPNVSTIVATNSANTSPLAATFNGNVEIKRTSAVPLSGNLLVQGTLSLPRGSGANRVLTSDSAGNASWQNGIRALKAVIASDFSLPNISSYSLPLVVDADGGFEDLNYFSNSSHSYDVTEAGVYLVAASVTFNLVPFTGPKYFHIAVSKGSFKWVRTDVDLVYNSQQGASRTISTQGIVKAQPGDYFGISVSQQTGVAQTIDANSAGTFLTVTKLY